MHSVTPLAMADEYLRPADAENDNPSSFELYEESLRLVERLHRRLLDVVKDEFDRHGRNDINSVQALLLANLGESELTAGELRSRGYYLGSNVSYNVKKLVDQGFLHRKPSKADKRAVWISLTPKGEEICAIVKDLYSRHLSSLEPVAGFGDEELISLNGALQRLERFWNDQIMYRM
jgi:DNA-binding MarR family transcriptional regulator